jgi:broad specificity phosphatase PhoE
MSQTILIIRHAEKPVHGGEHGIDAKGSADQKSLTPRGWQRAGAWVELFAPSLAQPSLPAPGFLFASAPANESKDPDASKSERPLQTLTPLAQKLGLPINLDHTKGHEDKLARTISTINGVVLVCWQHESILSIVKGLKPELPAALPHEWPDDRFNVIFRLRRAPGAAPWVFDQLAPVMLQGDASSPI